MLRIYTRTEDKLVPFDAEKSTSLPIWLDLISPNGEDVARVEGLLGVDVPSRAEMEEIELSARLYSENGATFMTLTALANLDTETPIKTPITFILKNNTLVSVRYAEPKPFLAYTNRAQRPNGSPHRSGDEIMLGLIEAMIDRTADALERLGNETDTLSREVFKTAQAKTKASTKTHNLENVISLIGLKAELLTMIQESLVSISRLVAYYSVTEETSDDKESRHLVRLIQRDATSLGEHARALSSRLGFLLDATLGAINLEQNQIIKIFSVAAVVFLPPTLVASVYGMNFNAMPELDWGLGYPWALGLMVLSAALPFLYFKRKGWL
jgi:magnesium transporter